MPAENPTAAQSRYPIDRWLAGRSFADCCEEFDACGYLIFPNVLSADDVAQQNAALAPWLAADLRGRNNFEGTRSNRVYAMLAKDPLFADLISHPLQLAFAERELGQSCLLYACLAINLLPGETPQPWHFDDSHCGLPRPRAPLTLSTFWSLCETTHDNGATELIPGSHLWGDEQPHGANIASDFITGSAPQAASGSSADAVPELVQAAMPAGSLLIAKGTLWHRGGANHSNAPRLVVTPQYCIGWARPLEQQQLAVPREMAGSYPARVRELLGYNIHPPFMGYVDGMHPERTLQPSNRSAPPAQ
jgi:ectoine hydroxylase-related dioxygenase (phytanoyl-CoA dioxygenase family)